MNFVKYFFIVLIIFPFSIQGQNSGTITYEMTMKIDLGSRGDRIPKEIRDRIPKERKSNKELLFSETESIYKNGKAHASNQDNGDGFDRGRRFGRRFGGGGEDRQTYKNITTDQIVDKNEFMGKSFLIKDGMPKYEWKITGAKKKILDYLAMEATTMVDDSIQVKAWFTPQIAISNGPQDFHGLPGMILELDQDNGKLILVASEVILGVLDEDKIKMPKKGKEVTSDEFNEIRREKMKEMREQRGRRDGRPRGRG